MLGTEGGTYYAGEKEHTIQASKAVEECIKKDGPRTVARIVEISDEGRAPKNDPAIFALAMCAGAENPATRELRSPRSRRFAASARTSSTSPRTSNTSGAGVDPSERPSASGTPRRPPSSSRSR